MGKSITGCFIVLNEVDNIEYSLTNPLKILDKIIIIDGMSTDGTIDKIKEVANKLGIKNKIKVYVNKFKTLNEQRNLYLKYCETDYVMYIDGDEIIKTEDLIKIKENYINNYNLILVRSFHFYIDFYHIATSEGFNNSWQMPRIFKNIKGKMNYASYKPLLGDHSLYIDAIDFMEYFKNSTRICDLQDIAIYHLGNALGKFHQKEKLKFQLKYDHEECFDFNDRQLGKAADSSCYFDKRIWEDHINPDDNGIKKFEGQHPEIMKHHPLYNIHIIND